MNKVVVEVGSTNTKIDIYDGTEIKRLGELTILFKQHYKESGAIDSDDVQLLVDKISELKKEYDDVYVCGTSIFRDMGEDERKRFLDDFLKQTGLEFNIISQEQENELTVLGAARLANERVCVLVGGGGSTEISVFDDGITEVSTSSFGVMDVMNEFPDLAEDVATTPLETVLSYVEERLNVPKTKADILILAGGGHEMFARNSGINYEKNTLYADDAAPIMMDIETRKADTKKYFEKISLDEIRARVSNPDWWFASRAMCAFALVVAEKIEAKYIVPTNISMIYGIIEKSK